MAESDRTGSRRVWREVLEPGDLAEGGVRSVPCGTRTLCPTRFEGRYRELDAAFARAFAHDGFSLVAIRTDATLV